MKLFDRQKKWEINLYSYYDHAGIVRHLEDMARQGWQLEKSGSVFWTYRRCEPTEAHYAVVYFSKASQFDPEPPAEQREFWELCKATGWELVTNRYQMQIFRNPAPDAIPIETDPVVQVENVRAAMKKGSARANWCLLICSLLQLWLQFRSAYTIRDLLLHYPRRYIDYSQPYTVVSAPFDVDCCVKATVLQRDPDRRIKGGRMLSHVLAGDDTGMLALSWFNAPYAAEKLEPGTEYYFEGRVGGMMTRREILHPLVRTEAR